MRIVLVSSTHELCREPALPPGGLLVHAGGFALLSKRPWMCRPPRRRKTIVPGNHEHLLEDGRERRAITNGILLVGSGVEIEGLKVWGSPVTPLYGGAFGLSRAAGRMRRMARVPAGPPVLATHGPPQSGIRGGPQTLFPGPR
jgi:hypothetical protein